MRMILLVLVVVSIAAQIENGELLKVVGYIRHGARTAIYNFNDQDWDGYGMGELTEKGIQQHLTLGGWRGKQYKSLVYVVDDQGQPIMGECDKDKLQMIFSCVDRTIKSGIAFIQGMCYKNKDQIIPYIVEQYLAPLITESEYLNKLKGITDFSDLSVFDQIDQRCTGTMLYFQVAEFYVCPTTIMHLDSTFKSKPFQTGWSKFKLQPEYNNLIAKWKIDPKDEDIYIFHELHNGLDSYIAQQFQGVQPNYHLTIKELEFLNKLEQLFNYPYQNGDQFLQDVQMTEFFKDLSALTMQWTQPGRLLQVDLVEESNSDTSGTVTSEQTEETSEQEVDQTEKSEQEDHQTETQEQPETSGSEEEDKTTQEQPETSEPEEEQTETSEPEEEDKTTEEQSETSEAEEDQTETQEQSETEDKTTEEQDPPEVIPQIPEVPVKQVSNIPQILLNQLQYDLNDSGLSIYSGHDTQIAALLSVFLTEDEQQRLQYSVTPPFAANIFIEFWKVNSQVEVAIRYNNRRVNSLTKCPTESKYTCTLNDFQAILDDYTLDDVLHACYE